MIPFPRPAALLAAALLLTACASASQRQVDEEVAKVKERNAKEAADQANPRGKAALYRRITQLTDNWMAARSSSSLNAADEANALSTAIARETWERFDDVVADLATSDNPRWRVAAARGLGFVQNPKVVPALEGALRDSDASVLAAALVSLGLQAAPEISVEKVSPLLTYPDKYVASNAALCLARVFQSRRMQKMDVPPKGTSAGLESDLQVLLFDPVDPILRGTAAQALGELATPACEDALLNRVRDENTFVRMKVVQALAQAGSPKGYDILLDSLGREQLRNVQSVTALAIGSIAERQGLRPDYSDLGVDAALWRRWLKK
jgi:HEAT repeat protein